MIELWGRTYKRFLGEEASRSSSRRPAIRASMTRNGRKIAFFDFMKQAYLLTGKWAEAMIENAATVDGQVRHRAQFYLNQLVSALSPSNFPFTNPEVIRATVSTGAQNLARA